MGWLFGPHFATCKIDSDLAWTIKLKIEPNSNSRLLSITIKHFGLQNHTRSTIGKTEWLPTLQLLISFLKSLTKMPKSCLSWYFKYICFEKMGTGLKIKFNIYLASSFVLDTLRCWDASKKEFTRLFIHSGNLIGKRTIDHYNSAV